MRLARLAGTLVVAALMLTGVVARGQVAPDAEQIEVARRHLAQGIALYNDGNFSAALAEFQAVYATKPTPGVLYNIGLTYKGLFQYNEAIHALEQYEGEEKQLTPERRAEVTQILAEMQALLAPMTLAITPEGAEVKIDGHVIGRAPIGAYKIATGRHVIEASHDDAGIIWPDSVAPWKAAILNLKLGDAKCDALCEDAYAALGGDALYDDRQDRAGAKFADADLMGHPWQIVVGPRGAAAGKVELKRRASGERADVTPEEALNRIG